MIFKPKVCSILVLGALGLQKARDGSTDSNSMLWIASAALGKCSYIYIYICIYIHIYIHTLRHISIHNIYVEMLVYVYIYMYIHTSAQW